MTQIPTYIPERLHPLFELAKRKGYDIKQNADRTISLVLQINGKPVGRWTDIYGAIQYLKRQRDYVR